MPAIVKRLTERDLLDAPCPADSLAEAALYEPRDGVYTVANTFNRTQTLLLDAHFDRLEASALLAGFTVALDRGRLRAALRQTILASGFGDARFRISVPANAPGEVILSIEPFHSPAPKLIRQGVRCATTSAARRDNPAAKSSKWMRLRRALKADMPADAYETFLLDERGYLREGLSSNFYALHSGVLRTAGSGVLAGISRRIVLEVSVDIVPLCMRAPHFDNLARFSEAFLTSSSRGIIPVVAIDGVSIGDGEVGAVTLQLREAYQEWVRHHLEEL